MTSMKRQSNFRLLRCTLAKASAAYCRVSRTQGSAQVHITRLTVVLFRYCYSGGIKDGIIVPASQPPK